MTEATKTPDLENALQAFQNGEMSIAARHLARVDLGKLPKAEQTNYFFTLLAIAMHGRGDLAFARRANAQLNPRFQAAMRYRYSLRAKDIATAKKIRSAGPYDTIIEADFKLSASLSCLWSGKLRSGLRLYKHRHSARNFGKFVPEGAIYHPFDGQGEELQDVFLEQGLGDILLHLAVMREVTAHKTHNFVGDGRIEPFIKRYFPGSTLRPWGVAYDDLKGRRMHGSGDYLTAAYLAQGRFPTRPFCAPKPGPFPIFGVCWRGGSAQNRREERRFNLEHFLDLLPQGITYVPLQFDMTKAETARLHADSRFAMPGFDLRSNSIGLLDHIASLAGVISVDSANWHIAGLSGVPIYGLINRRKHWYWGQEGQISSVYPNARTVAKDAARTEDIATWAAAQTAPYLARPAVRPTGQSAVARPVFITGFPRSGTSMVTGILASCGLWMGPTIKGNADNAKGFFENREIRDAIVKPALRMMGCDPAGTIRLPRPQALPFDPTLRHRVLTTMAGQGHDGRRIWGYKEPKLALLWPQWMHAFPDAHWVIVEREEDSVVASCVNTGFMQATSVDPEFWRTLIARYSERLDLLETTAHKVTRISADQVASGDHGAISSLVAELGLTWSARDATRFVDQSLFGRPKT